MWSQIGRPLSISQPSISEAERGVYHDCSLSETATTAVSTTRLRKRAASLVRMSGEVRGGYRQICYHDRASPKLDIYLSSSVPTLSISDAERGVYHDCSLSETATTAVSTTRLRKRAASLVRMSGEVRGGYRQICYHDRASPKLDIYLSSSVPTLSISDAERGVYHDCSLSETATTAVSTTRLRSRAERAKS